MLTVIEHFQSEVVEPFKASCFLQTKIKSETSIEPNNEKPHGTHGELPDSES